MNNFLARLGFGPRVGGSMQPRHTRSVAPADASRQPASAVLASPRSRSARSAVLRSSAASSRSWFPKSLWARIAVALRPAPGPVAEQAFAGPATASLQAEFDRQVKTAAKETVRTVLEDARIGGEVVRLPVHSDFMRDLKRDRYQVGQRTFDINHTTAQNSSARAQALMDALGCLRAELGSDSLVRHVTAVAQQRGMSQLEMALMRAPQFRTLAPKPAFLQGVLRHQTSYHIEKIKDGLARVTFSYDCNCNQLMDDHGAQIPISGLRSGGTFKFSLLVEESGQIRRAGKLIVNHRVSPQTRFEALMTEANIQPDIYPDERGGSEFRYPRQAELESVFKRNQRNEADLRNLLARIDQLQDVPMFGSGMWEDANGEFSRLLTLKGCVQDALVALRARSGIAGVGH